MALATHTTTSLEVTVVLGKSFHGAYAVVQTPVVRRHVPVAGFSVGPSGHLHCLIYRLHDTGGMHGRNITAKMLGDKYWKHSRLLASIQQITWVKQDHLIHKKTGSPAYKCNRLYLPGARPSGKLVDSRVGDVVDGGEVVVRFDEVHNSVAHLRKFIIMERGIM
jgi:hypothetical protein